ncbi:MAG: HAMP domain-containing sensor histidine kinase [Patescibacteria group bacterium]|mgnify:CR=1 FL=1
MRDASETQPTTTSNACMCKECAVVLGTIAHSLQTPLTIVKGEISLLKKDVPNQERLIVCESVLENMSLLVYDALRLRRLVDEKEKQTRKKVCASCIVKNVSRYIQDEALTHGISVTVHTTPNVMICAVPHQIEELLMTLVENSIKYMHQQAGNRMIALTLSATPQRCVVVVEDNGIGIPSHEHKRVLEPLYRSEMVRYTIPGSGLGLPIAAAIAQQHNGRLTLASKPGVGTKVTISLPRAH